VTDLSDYKKIDVVQEQAGVWWTLHIYLFVSDQMVRRTHADNYSFTLCSNIAWSATLLHDGKLFHRAKRPTTYYPHHCSWQILCALKCEISENGEIVFLFHDFFNMTTTISRTYHVTLVYLYKSLKLLTDDHSDFVVFWLKTDYHYMVLCNLRCI